LRSAIALHVSHDIVLALRRSKIAEQKKTHETAQQHEEAIYSKSTVGYRGATTCNARLKPAPNKWFKTLAPLTGTG